MPKKNSSNLINNSHHSKEEVEPTESTTQHSSTTTTRILVSVLVLSLGVIIAFYLQLTSSSSASSTTSSSSRISDLPSFSVCSSLSDDLDAVISPSPTSERSEEVQSYIYNGSAKLLSFGTRVAGATNKGRRRALRFIKNFNSCLQNQTENSTSFKWIAKEDKFSENTVLGPRQFTNFILESECSVMHKKKDDDEKEDENPNNQQKHLVIAAHWDSKLFKEFEFVGACDSAVPVVMMMRLAKQVTSFFLHRLHHNQHVDCSSLPKITFMFLDGEEAFVNWAGNDNTYGSRHLANVYEKEGKLKSISLFMLLDLLGPKQPQLWNYFKDKTGDHFTRMQQIEEKQRTKDQLRRTKSPSTFFSSLPHRGGVDDDHRHWMQKGVPILHIIPLPFPPEWHKQGDTIDTIDFEETVVDLYNIISEFVLTF